MGDCLQQSATCLVTNDLPETLEVTLKSPGGHAHSGGCWQFKFQVISEGGVKGTQPRAERKEGNDDDIIQTEAGEAEHTKVSRQKEL